MPRLLEIMRNPLGFLARRWTPAPSTVHRAALTALVMSVVIVVTGGAVRLTGSGLGCETWPKCGEDSLTATAAMGWHGAIEFGNRMLTYVLCAAVGWAIVAARSATPRRHGLSRLAWAQFWLVMGNAVVGGVTVLTGLNPYTVAGHFLLATALITVAAVTWQRSREGDHTPRPLAGRRVTQLARALTGATGALVVVGTAVTGSGPHAGDNSEVPRMPFGWEAVAQVHSALAWIVVTGTVALWVLLRAVDAPAGPRARTRELLLVLLLQGVLGYTQYATELPETLVGLHLLGSTLVWIAMLRVLLSLRERGPVPTAPGSGPTAASTSGTDGGYPTSSTIAQPPDRPMSQAGARA